MSTRTRARVGALLICQRGELTQATPANAMAYGFGEKYEFTIDPANDMMTAQDQAIPNQKVFQIKGATHQFQMVDIQKVFDIYAKDSGADVQVVIPDNGTDRIYNFHDGGGSYLHYMGVDAELLLSNESRKLALTLKLALEKYAAQDIVSAALVNTLHPWLDDSNNGLGDAGLLYSKVSTPELISIESPSLTTFVAKDEIISRSLSLKFKGKENMLGQMDVDWITATLKIQCRNAGLVKLLEVLSKDIFAAVTLRERTASNKSEIYAFAAGTLALSNSYKRSNDEAYIDLTFKADISPDKVTYDYSNANQPYMIFNS